MLFRLLFSLFIVLSFGYAQMFQSVAKEKGTFVQKGETKYYCPNCGMNLPKFYKTNHVHEGHQYCSLHCLVEATKGKIPEDAKVVDTKSLKFISVKDAFYVVGSSKPGTMSVNSKYAFSSQADAKEFMQKNGGKIVNFLEAYSIAQDDFKKDTAMINIKREKKIYGVGKKLYASKCEKIDVASFATIAELKAVLKLTCKVKDDKPLQAMAVYLWDTQKLNKQVSSSKSIQVPKGAKCPICGMFVEKYPKWVAMIDAGEQKYYFDGVKDMMKFILSHKNSFEKVYASDYFTTNKIDAKKAYFVLGANVYGPMGKELIPFDSKEKALSFQKDHFGKKVLSFDDITQDVMNLL